jgi:hypothetical protein
VETGADWRWLGNCRSSIGSGHGWFGSHHDNDNNKDPFSNAGGEDHRRGREGWLRISLDATRLGDNRHNTPSHLLARLKLREDPLVLI